MFVHIIIRESLVGVGWESCEQRELLVTVSCYPLNARSTLLPKRSVQKAIPEQAGGTQHALVRLEAIPISLLVTCSPELTQGSVHYYRPPSPTLL